MKRLKHMADENITPDGEGQDGNIDTTPDEGGDGSPADEQKIRIGDNDYTPEQLNDALKKANDYDALLPEFTTKSQLLSKLLGGGEDKNEKQEEIPSFLQEGWKPKNFAELGQALKEAIEWGEKRQTAKEESTVKEAAEAKKIVDGFYVEVRKTDKEFDEADFGAYVKRHNIRIDTVEDLKATYSTYHEANIDGKAAERRALYNKNIRAKDSVSKPGTGKETLPFNPQEMRATGGRMLDLAKDALSKINK